MNKKKLMLKLNVKNMCTLFKNNKIYFLNLNTILNIKKYMQIKHKQMILI